MKKLQLLFLLCLIGVFGCACTKQVVFLDRDLNTTKADFDKYIQSTGFNYKNKDDVNNIYNVHLTDYNYQFLLQSKPIVSYEIGFTCKFKDLGNDTLMNCTTYPSSLSPLTYMKKHLKEQKFDDVKYISYKKYQKMKANKGV